MPIRGHGFTVPRSPEDYAPFTSAARYCHRGRIHEIGIVDWISGRRSEVNDFMTGHCEMPEEHRLVSKSSVIGGHRDSHVPVRVPIE